MSGQGVTLVGGGLGGALLAAYLGREGLEVDLYERRPDPLAGNFTAGGRSINLAISVRGLHALAEIGLEQPVLEIAVPMRGRVLHLPDGTQAFQPYDKDPGRCIHSVSRGGLNTITLEAARALPNVRVHFDRRCVDVDIDRPAAEFVGAGDERQAERVESRVMIGVDGAYSVVRRALQRTERFDYSQQYLGHGYKELTIPPDARGQHAMRRDALHIWPRRSYMMIALPNPDGSFTCTLFFPFVGPLSFDTVRSGADARRLFEAQFGDALPLMPTLTQDFENNPTGSMVTVRSRPWRYRDRVALLGDAAHAVVPFYGQGMNAAFEDVVALRDAIRAHRDDWGRVFDAYESARRENVNALADLALNNFVEMRDHTGSRHFRMHKRLERRLHGLLSGWYTPLYTMVSFSRTPYAEAVRRARAQDATVSAAVGAVTLLLIGLLIAFTPTSVAALGTLLLAAAFVGFWRLLVAYQPLRTIAPPSAAE